ncbi:hypothetical protein EDD11_000027 [Mortierella claussenii]|nr:hypothetical protein EDD11_000027 [Mortierella claussenii]
MEGLENKSEDQGEDQVEVKEDEEGEAESEELAEEQARAACRKNKRRKKSAAAAANVAHLHAGSITTRKRGLKASLPSGQETSSLWSLPAPERQRHQQRQHHPQQPQQHCPTESDSRQHQLSSSSTSVSLTASTAAVSSTHCSNFITEQQFLMLAEDYLMSLSPKKREKALLSNSMYQKILMVLIQPKNTQVSTAQFRFWAKKMFTLSTTPTHHVVCHGGKPVATKECLYDVLVYCHRKSSHGGRDKTSAEVSFYMLFYYCCNHDCST